jgi:hypothetical protein
MSSLRWCACADGYLWVAWDDRIMGFLSQDVGVFCDRGVQVLLQPKKKKERKKREKKELPTYTATSFPFILSF